MANLRPIDKRLVAGAIALAALLLLVFGAFAGLLIEAWQSPDGAFAAFDTYLLRIARFTIFQALLSTILSIIPALFIARSLYRQPNFPGRHLLLQIFAVPLALPAIVAALGLLALYGRAGLFAEPFSSLMGAQWPGIYGLSGILIAHVFFNMPLATRIFLEALNTISPDQHRLSAQLGFRSLDQFRLIEWPVLRAAIPSTASLILMLCVTSFTLVLTLGGGPSATTLEVAIYQALRFEFEPSRAVALTITQIALTIIMIAMITLLGGSIASQSNLANSARRYGRSGQIEPVLNGAIILAALLFVCAPLIAIMIAGLQADLARLVLEPEFQNAALTSLLLASLSSILALALSWSLIRARQILEQKRRQRKIGLFELLSGNGAGLVLVVPPIVIGAGWFILLRHFSNVFALAPIMVVSVNAAMAMPFAMRLLRPAHDDASNRQDRLCAQLGIKGWNRFRLIDFPLLRRVLLAAFAFAMALSLGDLGVIALFGSESVQTLPYLLLSRLSSYRTADANGLALLLGALTLALMLLANLLGKTRS